MNNRMLVEEDSFELPELEEESFTLFEDLFPQEDVFDTEDMFATNSFGELHFEDN